MKISLNIDSATFNKKPYPFPGALRNRLCSPVSIREIDPAELIRAVERGQTFTPAVMTGTTGDTWQSQQVICADIDNDTGKKDADGKKIPIADPLTPARALEVMKRNGIAPYFMYYSFSNTEGCPKYRVVLILDKPVTDPAAADDAIKRFTGIFNRAVYHSADPTAADRARLYFGGRPGSAFYKSGKFTTLAALLSLPAPPEEPADQDAAQAVLPLTRPSVASAATVGAPGARRRSLAELEAQLEHDRNNFDLAGYIERTEPRSKRHKVGRVLYFNPCPLCGHNDDFQVTGHLYHCYGASGGTGGTIIDYLKNRYHMSTPEALEKFKYEVMGYSRNEWKAAFIAEKHKEQMVGGYNRPQGRVLEFGETVNLDENGAPADSPREAETAAQDATPAPDIMRTAPAGLLTFEGALNAFETADDRYLELKSFPEFSKAAKIKVHDTVILAADTGMGKSSLAINFLNDLNDRFPVLYFNLEMDSLTILRRLVAINSGMEVDRIAEYKRDPTTAAAVKGALKALTSRQPLQILEDVYSLEQIEQTIKAATAGRQEPVIVIIDHALLVTTGKRYSGRYERFTIISEYLRRISRENNIIMLVLLQQNRAGKENANERPTNASLKESGSWENDSTHILFLWYDQDAKRKKLIITKNRDGSSGEFTLNYWKEKQIYTEAKDRGQGPNIHKLELDPLTAKAKQTPREKKRAKLEAATAAAIAATDGKPTLHDIAEEAGVTVATVKTWIKEFGGFTLDGVPIDPAGIDETAEYTGIIRMTGAAAEQLEAEMQAGAETRANVKRR